MQSSFLSIYLPINLSSPTPNKKYVSKWENRSSLKFIERYYQKIAVIPPVKAPYEEGRWYYCIWRVFIMFIA